MTVEQRLHHVQTKQPLVHDEIDFTVRDPSALTAELAAPLEYAQRVEAAVVASGIEMLMPNRDERIDAFLEAWTLDEQAHARALGELMTHLGLAPTPVGESELPLHNRLISALAARSSSLHDVVTTIWAIEGAMNEHMAMAAYNSMDSVLQRRDERALHETLMRRLRAHESAHKSFYSAVAVETWERLSPWQRRLARRVVVSTYAPVGAGAARDRPAFSRTVIALSGGRWQETIADPVQQVADRLLGDDREVPPFVRDAIAKCLASEPDGAALLDAAA